MAEKEVIISDDIEPVDETDDNDEEDPYEQFRNILCCVIGKTGIAYDFTPHIVVPTYNVRTQPEWYEWTDGNFAVHRELKRLTTSGSFTLYYDDPDELNEMLEILRNNGVDNEDDNGIRLYVKTIEGSVSAAVNPDYTPTLYGDVPGTYALSYSLKQDIPYYGRKAHDGVEIQITNKLYSSGIILK